MGGFTDEKKAAFLTHFAESCNVAEAARQAGVGKSTLYARRLADPAFRAAWAAALDSGTTMLRAELVRRGLELLQAAEPSDDGQPAIVGMDARFLLNLVESHERNAGKAPGEIQPQYSDAEEAAARLEQLLVRKKAEQKRKKERSRAERSS